MLAPIAPHMCHQLWQDLGHEGDVLDATWPEVDQAALVEDEKLIVVQVNGKLRAKLTVAAGSTKEQVEALAFAEENVSKFIEGKEIRKVIYVPGKLLNVVAN
jgi:leucyl-tRNA synthetase